MVDAPAEFGLGRGKADQGFLLPPYFSNAIYLQAMSWYFRHIEKIVLIEEEQSRIDTNGSTAVLLNGLSISHDTRTC